MRTSWEQAIAFVLDHEGGYVNDVDDPGGETKYGISKRYHPDVDVASLTRDGAAAIYLDRYWVPNGCDVLPHPLDVVHFDSCVNLGPGAAGPMLYMARGQADVSLQAVTYLDLRMRYYLRKIKESPVKAKYIQGWLDRCLDLLEEVVLQRELVASIFK
jgi:hypothetical protein